MTIVESKDELWQTMANDKLSCDDVKKSSVFSFPSKKLKAAAGDIYVATEIATDAQGIDDKEKENEEAEEDNESNPADAEDGNNSPGNQTYTKTYALPENVVVVTGEEEEECLLQVRVKLFRLAKKHIEKLENKNKKDNSSDEPVSNADVNLANQVEWVEVGIGPLKILRNKPNSELDKLNAFSAVGGSDSSLNSSSSISSGRLVMRREDKKGGIGNYYI